MASPVNVRSISEKYLSRCALAPWYGGIAGEKRNVTARHADIRSKGQPTTLASNTVPAASCQPSCGGSVSAHVTANVTSATPDK
jgi:hypothetical protein